jgi:hypothetical protein
MHGTVGTDGQLAPTAGAASLDHPAGLADLRDLAEVTAEQAEDLKRLWTGRPATVGASQPAREELTGMDEQPTDAAEPQIIDHPFQPGRPPQEPTECGWDAGVWLCGFSRAEHADQGTDRQGDESTPP